LAFGRVNTDFQPWVGIAHQPVCLQPDDGALLWPMADDEGNDAGALFIQSGNKTSALPAGAPRI
jgi:hypothetical protein